MELNLITRNEIGRPLSPEEMDQNLRSIENAIKEGGSGSQIELSASLYESSPGKAADATSVKVINESKYPKPNGRNLQFFMNDAPSIISCLSALGFSFDGVGIRGVIMQGMQLVGANWAGIDIGGSNFSSMSARYISLENAKCVNTILANSNLSNSNIQNCDLSNAVLASANLTGANLSNSKITNANAAGLNLSGANLIGTNFSNSNLNGSNLEEVIFSSQTNFSGTTLAGCDNLPGNINTKQKFREAMICNAQTIWIDGTGIFD